MIKLRNLICEIIAERMSYADLMKSSDKARYDRSKRIPVKPLVVKSINDREAWKFSYKTPSDENTTGLRHQGFIYFFKDDINTGEENVMKLDCSVDCSCPDYKYRWAYNNKKADAGELGGNSLNKNNGASPQPYNDFGPGLCKHLLALKEYLKTEVNFEPTQPSQTSQPQGPRPVKPVVVPASPPPDKAPPEEPEEIPVEKEPTDPTQSPEPTDGEELPIEPETQPEVPTLNAPEEPDEVPIQGEVPEEPPAEENPDKKKIKEMVSNVNELSKSLDDICRNQPIFIVK